MSFLGLNPKQGQIYAQAMTFVRQLDLKHLRLLKLAINGEIIKKKIVKKNEF